MKFNYQLLKQFDIALLQKYKILPFDENEISLYCYGYNKDSEIENTLQKPIKLFTQFDYKKFELELLYLKEKLIIYDILNQAKNIDPNQLKNSKVIDNFFYNLFKLAISQNCSDIHIESNKNYTDIRFRIDGDLILFFRFDKDFLNLISTVIKIYASLDISISFMPQDARFSFTIDNQDYDFRVSIMPLIDGESIVIRILDNKNVFNQLDNLGFEQDELNTIYKILNLSKGLILVTGPTGRGKTTTLYAMLNYLVTLEKLNKSLI